MIARRAVLRGACAFAGVIGCGRRVADSAGGPGGGVDSGAPDADSASADSASADSASADSASPVCADDIEPGGEGWVAVALADYPELADIGGYAYISLPESLLQATILHLPDDCFATVWRICTHGACETEWVPDDAVLECPCHGSRFDTEGAILVGPATVPLRTFQTVRRGDVIWIYRPI